MDHKQHPSETGYRSRSRSAGRQTSEEDCRLRDDSSVEEIGACIERTRRHLGSTLQVLESRLSLKTVMGNARDFLQQRLGGSKKMTVGQNPAPFTMLGIALLVGGAGLAGYAYSQKRKNDADDNRHERQMIPMQRRMPAPLPAAPLPEEEDELIASDAQEHDVFNCAPDEDSSTESIYRGRVLGRDWDERDKNRFE